MPKIFYIAPNRLEYKSVLMHTTFSVKQLPVINTRCRPPIKHVHTRAYTDDRCKNCTNQILQREEKRSVAQLRACYGRGARLHKVIGNLELLINCGSCALLY